MWFNVSKCVTLRFDRSLQSKFFTYHLDSESLNCVTEHSYLVVLLTSSMTFSPHIKNIISKASKMVNFIRQNLSKCSKEMKSIAYLSLVYPISTVWDPHLISDIQNGSKTCSSMGVI